MTAADLPLSLRALLRGAVDYAGLFPPASLDMYGSVRRYAAYLAGAERWLLGRFVVSASRLDDFEQAIRALTDHPSEPIAVSALIGAEVNPEADITRVARFNSRWMDAVAHGRGAVVQVLETRAGTTAEIARVLQWVPRGLTLFVEIPITHDPRPLLEQLAAGGTHAKMRCGGTTPDYIPSTANVARFIASCLALGLPFKATAGLHHAMRGCYPLTYDVHAARAELFGFLNVFFAATALRAGAIAPGELGEVLEESSAESFRFDDVEMSWRERVRVSTAAIDAARTAALLSIGSCSFTEPVDDLRAMGLGPATP
ncbi:MAG TPA: hypothetical protein VFW89_06200 [Gemmatimonadaceae bacterium]|nr:hypothetical protein [Gemmatimonadaceae bacterium]